MSTFRSVTVTWKGSSVEIKGSQFGVRLGPAIGGNNGLYVQLLTEDDENWFEVGHGFSSLWLDDLIDVLCLAKAKLSRTKGGLVPPPKKQRPRRKP